jgi:hypothetical protein
MIVNLYHGIGLGLTASCKPGQTKGSRDLAFGKYEVAM